MAGSAPAVAAPCGSRAAPWIVPARLARPGCPGLLRFALPTRRQTRWPFLPRRVPQASPTSALAPRGVRGRVPPAPDCFGPVAKLAAAQAAGLPPCCLIADCKLRGWRSRALLRTFTAQVAGSTPAGSCCGSGRSAGNGGSALIAPRSLLASRPLPWPGSAAPLPRRVAPGLRAG